MKSINAIFIQSHAKELQTGRLTDWLNEFIELTSGDIPIRIFLDEVSSGLEYTTILMEYINKHNIEIVFVDTTIGENPTSVTWINMINYNTTAWPCVLLLETDCKLTSDYITALNVDMDRFDDWWIYGSIYCGNATGHFDELNRITHMNGIAVYNRTTEFINFANHVFYTQSGIDSAVNFDWLLAKYIHMDGGMYHRFIDSKHIINISPEWDRHAKYEPLKPCAKIIHCKKYIDEPPVTQFMMSSKSSIYEYDDGYVLFTTLYDEPDLARVEELRYCMQVNQQNKHISAVVVFTEHPTTCISKYTSESVTIVQTPERPTYHDMIEYANEHYVDSRVILANSDIYFDDTLSIMNSIDLSDQFYVLTRWCKHVDGSSYLPHIRNSSPPIDPIKHQDMVGLRWYHQPLLNDIGRSPLYDTYQESWSKQTDDIHSVYDMSVYSEQTDTKGLSRSTGDPCIWRNEHSADAWVFQAPYTRLDERYKIPIGTFRCDTWLNYLLIREHNKNNIQLSNPCLSIKTYHHDFLRTDQDKDYDNTGDKNAPWLDNIIDKSMRETLVHRSYVPWCML